MTDAQFLARLEDGTLAPSAFDHRGHVRAAFLILQAEPSFGLALDRMARSIKTFAAARGAARLYHETITVAFMAIINARNHQRGPFEGWPSFAVANPDLLADSGLVRRLYGDETLKSDLARTAFLLPGWAAVKAEADPLARHFGPH